MSAEDEFASVYKTDRPLPGDQESVKVSTAIDEELKVTQMVTDDVKN